MWTVLVARAAYKLADAIEVEASRSDQAESGGGQAADLEPRPTLLIGRNEPRSQKGVYDPHPREALWPRRILIGSEAGANDVA